MLADMDGAERLLTSMLVLAVSCCEGAPAETNTTGVPVPWYLAPGDVDAYDVGSAWWEGEEGSEFGSTLLLTELDGFGAVVLSSADEEGSLRAYAMPLSGFSTGEYAHISNSGSTGQAVGFGRTLAVVRAEDGTMRLVTGNPTAATLTWFRPAPGVVPEVEAVITGVGPDDELGAALATMPGNSEVFAVSAPGEGCGVVYVGRWGPDAGTETPIGNLTGDAWRRFALGECAAGPAGFGMALAFGDLHGSGAVDLVVGAPGDANGAGAAYVLEDVFGATEQAGTISTATAHRIEGEVGTVAFGAAVALGDLDGDGVVELVVGSPNYVTGTESAGSVFVFDTSHAIAATAGDADTIIRGTGAAGRGDAFGGAVAVVPTVSGSILAVGAPEKAVVYLLPGSGFRRGYSVDAAVRIDGHAHEFGASISASPAIDGAMIVGQPWATNGMFEPGAVWWFPLEP